MERGNTDRGSGVFPPTRIVIGLRSFRVRSLCTALLAFLVGSAQAIVLDPPSLRCLSVDAAGDVTLTWVPIADPTGEFLQYDIYQATVAAGPYTLVGTTGPVGQATYVHAGAGADTGARFYYVTTTSTSAPPNVSVPSDTLSTIYLQVDQSVPLGSAVQDWTLPHLPPLATAADSFEVHMEYPIGTWSMTQRVVNTGHHTSQVISICEDSLSYQVRLPDESGCVNQSNVDGATFQDVTPPTTPIIVTVSVDTATNHTVVDWEPSPEPDTDGYIIVLVTEGGNVILDTLYGQFNTEFIWDLGDAGAGPESFTIAAIDTCWKGTPPSPNTSATDPPHTTVFLETTYDKCARSIRVDWTAYAGWPVTAYDLYTYIDGGPLLALGTFPPTVHSYQQDHVTPDRTYCYVVRARGDTPEHVSLSNKACRLTDYPAVPQWNYLRVATVQEEGHVVVVDSVDLSATARRYHLERTFNGGPWEEIASAPGGVPPIIVFHDLDALTQERSYTYRVVVDDSCGVPALTSNVGTSILLLAESDLSGFNRLRWNGYVEWAGQVSGYVVYRSLDGGDFLPITITPPDQWDFLDDARPFAAGTGRFCYYVQALETGNPSLIDAVSVSNVACAVQQEEVWIPNAFIAGGINRTFKPVLAYVDVRQYELVIFNRWGQSIWSTTDPDEAWDGRVDDAFVPQGVYAYYCAFQNGAGKKFERRGTVTFLPGM